MPSIPRYVVAGHVSGKSVAQTFAKTQALSRLTIQQLRQVSVRYPVKYKLFIQRTDKVQKSNSAVFSTSAADDVKTSSECEEGTQEISREATSSELTDGINFLESSVHFVNLTNGLEVLPTLQQLGLPYSFVRIQSTACEQQNFEHILAGLDANLLMHLALGHSCVVYDYGSRNKKRGVPRALWYGLEYIRYALNYFWFGNQTEAILRGHSVSKEFQKECNSLSKSSKKRLKYFRRYIPPQLDSIRLVGIYGPTEHDPDPSFYVDVVHRLHDPRWEYLKGSVSGRKIVSAQSSSCKGLDGLLQSYGLKIFVRGISHAEWKVIQDSQNAFSVENTMSDVFDAQASLLAEEGYPSHSGDK